MKNIVSCTFVALFAASASAVTISIDAELLQTVDGTPMPVGGLVILTAAVSGTFHGPTTTSFAGGDEMVLKMWDLSSFSEPGIFSDLAADLSFSGEWDQGDALQLYWYPTLTLASTTPEVGTPYGFYTDSVGLDGSDPWITSGPSDTISLKFFTTDAGFLAIGGSNPTSAGLASVVLRN